MIVASGTPDELKRQVSGDAVVLTLSDPRRTEDAIAALEVLDSAHTPTVEGNQVQIRVQHGGAALPGLLRELDLRSIALDAVEVRRPTLDDVFLTVTGRSLRDDEPAA